MKKIIIAISMMLAMNIFLAVPALAENYQEYGLYDSDGNYKGMFYSIEEINDFLEETMTADARYIKCDGVNKHGDKTYTVIREATILLGKDAVTFICDMKQGDASAIAWGCDLTYDYVKINGDYRS